MNQCIRLVESLTEFSNTRPVKEVKQTLHGIVSVLGNIRMVNFDFVLPLIFICHRPVPYSFERRLP